MSTLKTNNIQHVDRSDPSIIINTDGSVNIAGTMTYEDVTSVDSVGIITARSGVNITGGNITLGDSSDGSSDDVLKFGAGSDLSLFHNGTDSRIVNTTGDLSIRSNSLKLASTTGEEYLRATANSSVDLFHDNVVKLTTNSDGYRSNDNVKAQFGVGSDLTLYHDGTNSYVNNQTGSLFIKSTNQVYIQDDQGRKQISCVDGAAVELYHAGVDSVRLQTTTTGVSVPTLNVTGISTFSGNISVTTSQQVVATFEGTGSSDPQIYLGDNIASPTDNVLVIGYDKADNRGYLTVGGDSDDVFTVANGGAIGINQSSPQRRLHIGQSGTSEANIRIQGGSDYSEIRVKDSDNNLSFHFDVGGAGSRELFNSNGSTGHFSINTYSYQALTITTNENGSNGPEVQLMHNSASPAVNDTIGQLRYSGKDSAGDTTLYSKIETKVTSVTNGSETGHLDFSTRGSGSYNSIFRLSARSTASAPSYTTDDMNGIILDTYNTGNPYPRYFSFIAKAAGNTDSNIGFWTESVGGSPTEKVRISNKGTLYSGGGTIPSDLATYASSLRGKEGVFGPIFYWPRSYGTHSNGSGYDNVAEGGRLTLRMHGAQGGTAAMFQGGFGFGYGSGGEAKDYNRLRVFFRVTRSGTSYVTGNVTFKLQSYYYTSGWADVSNSNWDFNGTDSERGYRWTSSNWISTSDIQGGTDVPSIAIKYDNDNGNTGNADMRIAAVYFQYAYFN